MKAGIKQARPEHQFTAKLKYMYNEHGYSQITAITK